MSLKATSLVIQSAPVPATFKGDPNALIVEMVKRLKILSPNGTNFIFIGDTQPTSNVGPWLKGGTQWWVWDNTSSTYIPQDVSASVTIPFFIGASTPAGNNPPVWLQTTQDASDVNPSFGTPIAWFLWNGSAWVSFNGIPPSGPTASRPTNPLNLQQFYDTDISVLIWWERNQWRTVTGSPGDVKAVTAVTLTQALTQNPGWAVLGNADINQRGRIIMQAAIDGGSNPVTTLAVPQNVPQKPAFSEFGETQGIQATSGSTLVYPPQLALWHLVKQ